MNAARFIACAALVLAGCSSETEPLTQIVVVVDSDFSGLTRFEAEVEGFEEPHTLDIDLEDEPLPQRFSLVHDGGELGPMSVTVRAFTDGDEPILVEPRTGMFFKAGQTLLLKIDLLAACVGLCDEDEACIAPGECVSSADAAVLIPWSGPPDGLDVGGPLDGGMDGSTHMMPDGSMDEGGTKLDASLDADTQEPDVDEMEPDARTDTGSPDANEDPDAMIDAGEDAFVPDPTWPFVPGNVDVEDDILGDLTRTDVALDCGGTAVIDSSDPPSASGFCDVTPEFAVVEQLNGGGEVLVVVMTSLSIDATSTLKLEGSRPIVLLVEGDASVAGTIDASAEGPVPGPGGDLSCAGSTGATGNDAPSTGGGAYGASGGGGGGFGSAGTASGAGGTTPSVMGGAVGGEGTLVPLRGGCSGGAGGLGDAATVKGAGGGGGGALQLSVAGTFELSGVIRAAGGGGGAGINIQGGGGGGGSGGAVLIEAETLAIDPAAIIAVNGGAGGGGQPTVSNMLTSTAGGDGLASTATSTPGTGTGSGGDGGRGAALGGAPTSGGVGLMAASITCPPVACLWGAGGGGGGGIGRIRVRGASACALPGTYSPAPAVGCETCGECSAPPDFTCSQKALGSSVYSLCPSAVTHGAARTACQGASQDLLKIDDAAENTFVASLINDDVWIGASDVVEDDWRWLVDNSQFWSGDEDGAAVGAAFNAWVVDDEPNGSGDCARLTPDAEWQDTSCTDSLPFVCEKP